MVLGCDVVESFGPAVGGIMSCLLITEDGMLTISQPMVVECCFLWEEVLLINFRWPQRLLYEPWCRRSWPLLSLLSQRKKCGYRNQVTRIKARQKSATALKQAIWLDKIEALKIHGYYWMLIFHLITEKDTRCSRASIKLERMAKDVSINFPYLSSLWCISHKYKSD